MAKVTNVEVLYAIAQCKSAIATIRGMRDREIQTRDIVRLSVDDFPGAKSFNNGAFPLLQDAAGDVPIKVFADLHPKIVFVVIATNENELGEISADEVEFTSQELGLAHQKTRAKKTKKRRTDAQVFKFATA